MVKAREGQDGSMPEGEAGDLVVRALAAGGQVRAVAARTTRLTEEARALHGLSPTATAALGRTLTAAALLGAMLKGDERVMIQIVGDGPLRQVVAEGNARGAVRGYVGRPDVHLPVNARGKLDVSGAIGRGYLHVVRDLGLREPYRGMVPLVSGEIAEDLAHYFARSEQVPAAVALGVLVAPEGRVLAAGGFVLQLMPGHTGEMAARLESQVSDMPPVSQLVQQGLGPQELLARALGTLGLEVLETRPLRFACGCSKEKFSRALVALGEAELRELARSGQGAELTCHFCSRRYHFAQAELEALLARAVQPGS